jgi:hypothetical protein
MRSQRDQELPHCGFPHWCQARKAVLALSNDELRLVLDRAPEPNLGMLLRSMGLQARSRKAPQLLRARLARMGPQPLHYLTWMLAASPIESLSEVLLGLDAEAEADGTGTSEPADVADPADLADPADPADLADQEIDLYGALTAGGLAAWAERWPAAVSAP